MLSFNNLVVQFIVVQKLCRVSCELHCVLSLHNTITTDLATASIAEELRIKLPRKEVIHRHVLVPMPCYDLTPIISPTLGRQSGLRVLVTLMV